ncbi:hypothetical protein OAF54_03240 [bacterium]|nr:hypothetical protein [bacterium]
MTYSQAYIDGIKEGRQYLNRFKCNKHDMQDNIDNIKSTMKGFSVGPVKDMLKGELDFWKAQIKKATK